MWDFVWDPGDRDVGPLDGVGPEPHCYDGAMSPDEIIEAARALSSAERWRLVEALLALDDADDPAQVEAAWSAEIVRREDEVPSGKAESVDAGLPEARPGRKGGVDS